MAEHSYLTETISNVLGLYARGYYLEAGRTCLESERTARNGVDRNIFKGLSRFLLTWDIDEAWQILSQCIDRLSESGHDSEQYKYYLYLLRGWTNSIERLSFSYLKRSITDLNKAISIYENSRDARDIRGWLALWFRANVYATLQNPLKAVSDYNASALAFIREFEKCNCRSLGEHASRHGRVIARVLCDRGMFFFDQGDFNLAIRDLDHAIEFDKDNPYVASNKGLVLCSMNEESTAATPLLEAYKLMETRRIDWQSRNEGEYYGSGRVYYNLGLLLYKWERCRDSIPADQARNIDSILSQDEYARDMFSGGKWREVFKTAASYYSRIKDPARAIPAIIISLDPLSRETSNPANLILWELFSGMGEFVETLVQHEHLVSEYFL